MNKILYTVLIATFVLVITGILISSFEAGLLRRNYHPQSHQIRYYTDFQKDFPVLIVFATKGRLANGIFEYLTAILIQQMFPQMVVGLSENVSSLLKTILPQEQMERIVTISDKFLDENLILVHAFEPNYVKGDFGSFLLPIIRKWAEVAEKEAKSSLTDIVSVEAYDYEFLNANRGKLLQLLTIKEELLLKAKKFLDLQRYKFHYLGNVTFVSIHIRRKDFLIFSWYLHKHELPSVGYVQRSIDYFKSNIIEPVFVICTDDMDYVNKHLLPVLEANVVVSDLKTAEEDFALLSSCSHSILTMGSFGFLAALKTRGEVVYPIYKKSQMLNTSFPTWPDIPYALFQLFIGVPA